MALPYDSCMLMQNSDALHGNHPHHGFQGVCKAALRSQPLFTSLASIHSGASMPSVNLVHILAHEWMSAKDVQ